MKTSDAARGKWRGLLTHFGAPVSALNGKHGPCPFCGGRDRFRWDNKDGSGSYFCSGCGSGGSGFAFLEKLKGWDFPTAAREIDAIIGNINVEPIKRKLSPEQALAKCKALWSASVPVEGTMAAAYLKARGITKFSPELRFAESCPIDGKIMPALLARVTGPDGTSVNVHRTFLNGPAKAAMEEPRRMMPGELPKGSAIRLWPHQGALGVAEGTETAEWARKRFDVPCWALINSTMLAAFVCPADVRELHIFGDNDPKFGGQAASYALAHRIACQRTEVSVYVHIPKCVGSDWADNTPVLEAVGGRG